MPATVSIDGTDLTGVAVEGSATRRLNRSAQAQVKIPMDAAIGGPGSKLKVSFDGTLFHHGRILNCETDSGEDFGYTVYNSEDPWELWRWRPARDWGSDVGGLSNTPGNFIAPSFFKDWQTGPQIVHSILRASEDSIRIPTAAEGPLFISYGSFAVGGVDLSGAPSNFPMTIAEVVELLTSTGEVDVVLTPIDVGGNMARVDVYNGNFGVDRSGSVVFEYAMGVKNVRRIRWNQDMTQVVNKLQYFFNRETQTRFQFNITGDDPCLADPPGGDSGPPPEGPLGARRVASQAAYGVRMEIKIGDTQEVSKEPPCGDPVREIHRRLWQIESWLRAEPRTLVHVTPVRGFGIGDFDIGDLVTVRASSVVRGGFAGVQRVYGYTVSWDTDGVLELSELQTSSDQEGI